MEEAKKLISKKLKSLIKEKFKTQKEFANLFNISDRTVTNWMQGKNYPNVEYLIKLAKHCELHISYFFTEDTTANVINTEDFNLIFKLAYIFADENNIEINGSYFLACYDLVKEASVKENISIEQSFNKNKSIILKFMK